MKNFRSILHFEDATDVPLYQVMGSSVEGLKIVFAQVGFEIFGHNLGVIPLNQKPLHTLNTVFELMPRLHNKYTEKIVEESFG